MNANLPHKVYCPELPTREGRSRLPSIRLSMVGDTEISRKQAVREVTIALKELSALYRITSLATIKGDEIGRAARLYFAENHSRVSREQVVPKTSDESDLHWLYQENAVGALMWRADHFVVFWSGKKPRLATSCIEQAQRLRSIGRQLHVVQL